MRICSRSRAEFSVLLRAGAFVERLFAVAIELAGQAGAALIDEDDVAGGADFPKCCLQQRQDVAAGLSWPPGKHEQRIGTRRFAQGRRQRDLQRQFWPGRVAVIQRRADGDAPQCLVVTGHVATVARLWRGACRYACAQHG
jgi:hypothetical protein